MPSKERNITLECQNCGVRLDGRAKNGRVKLFVKSRCVVLREDGFCEIKCHGCGRPTGIPLRISPKLLDNNEPSALR